MFKVVTIVGTRPEIIKLSLVIQKMEKHFEHILVHTGQNYDYELNEVFFSDLGIPKPKYFLEVAGKTAIQTIANTIVKADEVFEKENPDALLIYGDTNSCLSALSAKRRKIPIFHMEAGNRCFDQRVPEEINRKIVDHLSDINMPLTEHGRKHLLAEGLPANYIFKTGSCMYEILQHYSEKINKSKALAEYKVDKKKYFIVSAHREENVDNKEKLNILIKSLNQLSKIYNYPIIFSVHPRTEKRISEWGLTFDNDKIIKTKPLGFTDYVHLQKNAFCVISDSGTLMEESAILNFPAVHIRDSFERPEAMDVGTAAVVPLKPEYIENAVKITVDSPVKENKVDDYTVENVSDSVVKIIISHIDMINRNIWKK